MRRQIYPLIMAVAMIMALAALAVPVYAQPGTGTGPGPGMGHGPAGGPPINMLDMRMKMLQERLELSKDQGTKIRAILEDDQKVAVAEREKNKDNKEAAMKSREKRRQETDTKIKAVLTKDQVTKYDKMMEEFRQNRPAGPGMGMPKEGDKGNTGSMNPGTKATGK